MNDVVSTAFAGKSAGVVFEDERRFDLVVRLDSAYRSSIEDVQNLMIPTSSGNQVPLSQVSTIQYKLGPSQISREASKRRIVIGFNVRGRDVQSVVEEIQSKLDQQIDLPSGYYFTYGGTFENLQKASKRLMVAVPVSLLLIFMLLYFTFSSVKQAALIFTAIPMSAIGGVLALLLRGMPFSISAGIGFMALFGVAVLNGIVLISTFNQLQKEGWNDVIQRTIEGTKIRLRPVLMTATVASLGFLPMALSTSAGAEVQKPLATVVIGGLITATFLTLFILPMLYIIFNSKILFNRNSKMKNITAMFILFSLLGNLQSTAQTRTITIHDAIQIALENNNAIKAGELSIQSAQALKPTAGELPKLDLNAQLGQYNSIHFDQAIQLSQNIPFPSLFGARKGKINAEIKKKEWNKAITENELKKEVRSYYYQIEYLLHNKTRLEYLDSLYGEFIRVATVRYNAGDIKKIEISTAETKKGEINLLLLQNEIYLGNAHQNLKTLLNTSDSFIIAQNEQYQPLRASELLNTATVAEHPSVQTLYQDMVIAEQSKKVERRQGLPDITLGYSNQSLIGFQTIDGQEKFFNSGNRFSYGSVGIAIPLTYGATRARIKSLEYQKRSSEAEANFKKQNLETQLQNELNQYRHNIQEYNYYTDHALPNAKDITNAAQVGYRTGEISYVEYLYALQTATDIELKYLQSVQEVNLSVININALINQ